MEKIKKKVNSHIHQVLISIVQIILHKTDSNRQNRITLDPTSSLPKPWNYRALLMECMCSRSWDRVAPNRKSNHSCDQLTLHLDAISLCDLIDESWQPPSSKLGELALCKQKHIIISELLDC